MILIITHKEDYTADFVIEKLNSRNIPYFRFNCEDLPNLNYSFNHESKFKFDIEGISSFSSVWFRRTKLPEISITDYAQKEFLLSDYETLFDNIYNLVDCKRWLSEPSKVYLAENKLYQLKIAQELGFTIPDTIVTNNTNSFKKFAKSQDDNIIIKPIRQGRIYTVDGVETIFTNVIDRNTIQNIHDYELTPCIIQEKILKDYEVRVTVVGQKVFSAKISSQENDATKIDWRREKTPFTVYQLPSEIENKCIKLLQRLNISFGAIDLIRNVEGEYIFLEINPNGQWAWVEMETGLDISGEIINFLSL